MEGLDGAMTPLDAAGNRELAMEVCQGSDETASQSVEATCGNRLYGVHIGDVTASRFLEGSPASIAVTRADRVTMGVDQHASRTKNAVDNVAVPDVPSIVTLSGDPKDASMKSLTQPLSAEVQGQRSGAILEERFQEEKVLGAPCRTGGKLSINDNLLTGLQ